MKIKRIVCFSICLVMLLSTLVGCGLFKKDGAGDDESNGSDSVTETVKRDEYGQEVEKSAIPDELDYGGAEVIIASRSDDRFRREFGLDTNVTALDTRVYKRNEKVQTELGITLKIQADFDINSENTAAADIYQYVDTEYKSGQGSVDILGTYAAYAAQAGIRDYLVNLYDDSMTYLDLTKSCWNQTYVDAATLHGQLYYIVGDMNLTVWDRCSVNFVNLTSLEADGGMKADELYTLVKEGKWTIEKMYEIVSNIGWVDEDNSGAPSYLDSFGLAWNYVVPATDAYTSAFNFKMIKENDDGSLEFDIENNLTKFERAYESVAQMYRLQTAYRGSADANLSIFTDGRATFWTAILYRTEAENKKIRETKFEYTIVPLPKLEVDPATKYQTHPIDTYNTMIILDNKDARQLEISSATLQLLNEKSYSDVRPYYIEKIVKGRYVDGGDSVTMLETIFDGITFTKEWVYAQQTGGIASLIWRHVFSKEFADTPVDSSVSTQWQEFGSTAESDLFDLDEFFRASKE